MKEAVLFIILFAVLVIRPQGLFSGPEAKRDYYRFELANGARLWVFCDRSSGRWFLHGLFS